MAIDIRLHNTLSGKKESFVPIKKGVVTMYHCGPTVYNFAHIGNLRAYIFADILRRMFESADYKVKQVINITDIGHLASDGDDGDDKMVKGLKREGLPMTLDGLEKLADKYEEAFKHDLRLLNVETEKTIFPRASLHLKEEVGLIEKLDKKGLVYKTADGLYFNTSKINDYGKLGGLTPLDESRARVGDSEKQSPRDFALWKFSKDGHIGFKSIFGLGYPGWHIECSAMSMKYLGETLDIHTGGIDHIPVHHNDEIAQSEHATDRPFVHYWMHSEFVVIDDQKMAKSAENFITLNTLIGKGFDPLAYRYFILQAHYKTPINFTWEAIEGAANALKNLRRSIYILQISSKEKIKSGAEALEIVSDDLNTSLLIAKMWEGLESSKTAEQKLSFIASADKILGLNLISPIKKIPGMMLNFQKERDVARKARDWKTSDRLRKLIESGGFEVLDSTDGTSQIIPKL